MVVPQVLQLMVNQEQQLITNVVTLQELVLLHQQEELRVLLIDRQQLMGHNKDQLLLLQEVTVHQVEVLHHHLVEAQVEIVDQVVQLEVVQAEDKI